MTVSEYTHSQAAMLSLAWDGIAQSDVSSEYSSSYSELLEGILIAAGGSGTAELLSDTDLWAAIANQIGGTASSDTMTRPELIQEAVNALGGSANYHTDSEAEMIAQFTNLVEGGLGNLIISPALYPNQNTLTFIHAVTGGTVPSIFLEADFADPANQPWVFW